MENKNDRIKERGGRTMKIEEIMGLSLEEFAELDDAHSGFDAESTGNHPLRDEGETFLQFVKKGSEKIKFDPALKTILV